ncbi:DUF4123 domain-containing protein [Pseudomonas chlororaphis]|nr:DUF4123 domain-containing protein [Pseudomonas chlororaphis]WDG81645.1 DUF4123 domain-containing protein [Pseudomonas chlororaphis]WDG85302.1 DUF4123 domain-containing protein [Pseudomonas chlororaphis]
MTTSILLERTDDLLARLYQRAPDPNPTFLFDGTELADYTEQSPIWLEATSNASLLELMREEPEHWPGLIIESQAPTQTLLSHLRHILFIRFDQERRGVLRYSSPTTASYFFTVDDPQATATWMGPLSRLTWHGGTWKDLADGNQRWFNAGNPQARQWTCPAEQRSLHLDALHEQALQRQQKDHFIYQWWRKQNAISFSDASRYLDDGMGDGFLDAQTLNDYLSLRAQYPTTTAPAIPLEGDSEERLVLLRQHLEHDHQDKESLT